MDSRPRPLGLRLIIGYKLIKAPVVLGVALWLTLSSAHAYSMAARLVDGLGEHPHGLRAMLHAWLAPHLSMHGLTLVRMLAWLDGFVTLLEAALLLLGKPWGEWLVVAGLSTLLPYEVYSLVRHPRVGRLVMLLVNCAVVAYLGWRRWRARERERDRSPGGSRNCKSNCKGESENHSAEGQSIR